MNYWAPVALIAIFLLIAQTVGFGIAWRACQFGLDFKTQFSHNTPLINNSGLFNVSHNRCFALDDELRQC